MAGEADAVAAIEELALNFFRWRAAVSQPINADDVPRCERPPDFAPDWSASSLEQMQARYPVYWGRLRDILRASNPATWSRSNQVDAAVLAAHFERLRYEHTVLRAPWRNPDFYLAQSVGAVHDILVRGIEWLSTEAALQQLLTRLRAVPAVLVAGQNNLEASDEAEAEFGHIALANLEGRQNCLSQTTSAVLQGSPGASPDTAASLTAAASAADAALQQFTEWLTNALPTMRHGHAAVGQAGFEDFLRHVALVEWYSIKDLETLGELELRRSQAMSAMEETRAQASPPRPPLPDIAAQDATICRREEEIRAFVAEKGLLSVPEWLGRCHLRPIPPHLAPLFGLFSDNDMVVTDGLVDATCREAGGGSGREAPISSGLTRFTPPPSDDMGFFPRSCVYDPRPQICHEGFPGHQTQLAISQRHPRLVRRKYLDSVSNEGVGTYLEEMLLHAGLFDDQPHTRVDIWRYYRLRVLRIAADLKLGCGTEDLEWAATYLENSVPMDHETAVEDARMYLATPGLGLSYGVGKAQIMRFLALARAHHEQQQLRFDLRAFHDALWLNGNVPIELQAYEVLGGQPPPAIARLLEEAKAVASL